MSRNRNIELFAQLSAFFLSHLAGPFDLTSGVQIATWIVALKPSMKKFLWLKFGERLSRDQFCGAKRYLISWPSG